MAERFLIAAHPHAKSYFDQRAADVTSGVDVFTTAGSEQTYDDGSLIDDVRKAVDRCPTLALALEGRWLTQAERWPGNGQSS